MTTQKTNKKTTSSTKRGSAYLERLAKTGGAPVRVDLYGDELALVDELVRAGYESSRAGVLRKAMRSAYHEHFGLTPPPSI